jgi:hypothetical protein
MDPEKALALSNVRFIGKREVEIAGCPIRADQDRFNTGF